MSWKSRLACWAVRFLSPQDLREITNDTSVRVMARMDKEEKLAFIQSFVEENLGRMLAGLGREERAKLMNALLPKVAREFPLADLDILGAFSSAGDSFMGEEKKGV